MSRTHGMADLSAVDPSFIFGLQQVIQSGCWRYLMVESVKQEGGISLLLMLKNSFVVRPFSADDQRCCCGGAFRTESAERIYPVALAVQDSCCCLVQG